MTAHEPARRRILLVDCDAFYVQVARLEDPTGAGTADLLIVGGSGDGRGVVTSASYACRAFGVHSAMPTAEALRRCPDAMVVPVPRGACSARSRHIREVLLQLAPVVQAASIDEFYLDFTGTERLLRGESLEETARRVQTDVFEQTSIQVSIGGGTNRLVAKLASSRAKPNGVFIVPAGGEAEFLGEHALRELPGVGPNLASQLADRGLTTVAETRAVDPEWLMRWFGEARARWLSERLHGRDDSAVLPREPRRSVSSERTFAQDLDDDPMLERELLRLSVSVTATLRDEGLSARTVTVKVRDRDFTTRQRSHTLNEAVVSHSVVHREARRLLRELRERRRGPVRLLGLGLGNLDTASGEDQLGLFGDADGTETERDRTVAKVLDDVRSRFGRDALLPGHITPPRSSNPDD